MNENETGHSFFFPYCGALVTARHIPSCWCPRVSPGGWRGGGLGCVMCGVKALVVLGYSGDTQWRRRKTRKC